MTKTPGLIGISRIGDRKQYPCIIVSGSARFYREASTIQSWVERVRLLWFSGIFEISARGCFLDYRAAKRSCVKRKLQTTFILYLQMPCISKP